MLVLALLFTLVSASAATGPTCGDVKGVYFSKSCCGQPAIDTGLCATGTQWNPTTKVCECLGGGSALGYTNDVEDVQAAALAAYEALR